MTLAKSAHATAVGYTAGEHTTLSSLPRSMLFMALSLAARSARDCSLAGTTGARLRPLRPAAFSIEVLIGMKPAFAGAVRVDVVVIVTSSTFVMIVLIRVVDVVVVMLVEVDVKVSVSSSRVLVDIRVF